MLPFRPPYIHIIMYELRSFSQNKSGFLRILRGSDWVAVFIQATYIFFHFYTSGEWFLVAKLLSLRQTTSFQGFHHRYKNHHRPLLHTEASDRVWHQTFFQYFIQLVTIYIKFKMTDLVKKKPISQSTYSR